MQQLISKINGIDIAAVIDEDNNVFVPVKPICQALTIDFSAQAQHIKRHYILASTVVALPTVAADEKEREMLCLPLEYIYGWLFTIDVGQVAEARRELVANYQLECYKALYEHFTGSMRRTIETNNAEIELLSQINSAISDEKEAKGRRKKAERLSPRQIKFRGKRIDNGKWAYGYYFQSSAESHTIHWIEEDGAPWWADVDPETVGQYTGLRDQNGKEIYEGDILKGTTNKWRLEDKPEPHDFVGYVLWPEQCDHGLEWVLSAMDSSGWNPLSDYVHCVAIDYSTGTIIGNIHDNPEMLK